jgi:hypothetical protein
MKTSAEKEPREYFDALDTKYKMIGVLASAIKEMRNLGASAKDIAVVLRHAASELEADPG